MARLFMTISINRLNRSLSILIILGIIYGEMNTSIQFENRPAIDVTNNRIEITEDHVQDEQVHVSNIQNNKDKIAESISEKWKIPISRANDIVTETISASSDYDVDPLLILSITAQESAFQKVGNPGQLPNEPTDPFETHGLMQISGKWHKDKFPNGKVHVTTDSTNIQIGTRILKEFIDLESGNIERALLRYNGSIKDKSKRYSNSVLKRRDYFHKILINCCGNSERA